MESSGRASFDGAGQEFGSVAPQKISGAEQSITGLLCGSSLPFHADLKGHGNLTYTSMPDLRIKLAFVFAEGYIALVLTGYIFVVMTILCGAPLFIACGRHRSLWMTILCLGALYGTYMVIKQHAVGLGSFAVYILYLFQNMLFLFALCKLIIETSTAGQLMSALNYFNLKQPLVLALTITCRFIPTIIHEHRLVREAMLLRNIRTGVAGCFLHPVKYWEYILLPMITRASMLADELAASALTRGVEAPGRRLRKPSPLNRRDRILLGWVVLALIISSALKLWEI